MDSDQFRCRAVVEPSQHLPDTRHQSGQLSSAKAEESKEKPSLRLRKALSQTEFPAIKRTEGVGFEPTEALTSPVFKTGAINHTRPPLQSRAHARRCDRILPQAGKPRSPEQQQSLKRVSWDSWTWWKRSPPPRHGCSQHRFSGRSHPASG